MKLSYRPEIDGLRAIAVIGVLLFHAKAWGAGGGFVGVDIFFVISGYLITSILIRELDAKGRVDFINFWARRTRRLLPLALFVIVITLIASQFILSKIQFYHAARDGIYASIYLINWTKLISAVQYFDDGGDMGPYLHYWSLAVEEQFYLYITVVFVVAMTLRRFFARYITWSAARIVIALIVISSLLSLVANLYYITDAQPIAFFGTHARIWQLALGAGIGLVERSGFVPDARHRLLAAWLGLSAMLIAMVVYNAETSYPGLNALLPTCGAALFIFAGINGTHVSLPLPLRATSTRVPVAIGKISYSLYLWHWPVYVLWKAYWQSWGEFDIVMALGITFVLSIASYFTVENPIRFSRWLAPRPRLSLISATGLSAAVVILGLGMQQAVDRESIIKLNNGSVFSPELVRRDLPIIYRTKPVCHTIQREVDYPSCIFGSQESERKIFLFGDSHAAQWFPAFEKIASEHNFALYSRTKSACASIDIRQWHNNWKREYFECPEWRAKVIAEIEIVKPDFVVMANSSRHSPLGTDNNRLAGDARQAALIAGERIVIERIRATGAQVILMEETPWHQFNAIDCLVSNPGKTDACKTPIAEALNKRSPWSVSLDSDQADIHLIDMTENFCELGQCYVANNSHIMTRDKHHIPRAYALYLADILYDRLSNQLPELSNNADIEQ